MGDRSIVADEEFAALGVAAFITGVYGAVFGRNCLDPEALEDPSDFFVVV